MRVHLTGTAFAAAVVASVLSGCGSGGNGVPDRAADVTGVVAGADSAGGPVLAEPSDDYHDGMSLRPGDPTLVRGPAGEPVPFSELQDGDRIEVWVGNGCAESRPVSCQLVALRLPE